MGPFRSANRWWTALLSMLSGRQRSTAARFPGRIPPGVRQARRGDRRTIRVGLRRTVGPLGRGDHAGQTDTQGFAPGLGERLGLRPGAGAVWAVDRRNANTACASTGRRFPQPGRCPGDMGRETGCRPNGPTAPMTRERTVGPLDRGNHLGQTDTQGCALGWANGWAFGPGAGAVWAVDRRNANTVCAPLGHTFRIGFSRRPMTCNGSLRSHARITSSERATTSSRSCPRRAGRCQEP